MMRLPAPKAGNESGPVVEESAGTPYLLFLPQPARREKLSRLWPPPHCLSSPTHLYPEQRSGCLGRVFGLPPPSKCPSPQILQGTAWLQDLQLEEGVSQGMELGRCLKSWLQSRSSVATALLPRDLPGLCLLRPGPCPPAGSCTGIAPFSLPRESWVDRAQDGAVQSR